MGTALACFAMAVTTLDLRLLVHHLLGLINGIAADELRDSPISVRRYDRAALLEWHTLK
jgi:hypothetical protein